MSSPWAGWLPSWAEVDTGSMTLLIGWETSRNHVQVRRLPVNWSVASDLTEPVAATTGRLSGWTATAYSPDLELDENQYAVVMRDQLDLESSLLAGLETLLPPEGTTADLKRTLLFYGFAVGPANRRLIFLRRANPRRSLSRRYLTLFQDELTRVTSPLLSFDLDWVDLVLVAGQGLAVMSLTAYERLFRDSPELLSRTPTKVNEFNALVQLTPDSKALLNDLAIRNSRIRARLLAVLNRGHLSGLSQNRLRAEMSRHQLDPDRHLVNGQLDFTATEALSIMQLLNEDLTVGGLSDTNFVINKKSPRS